MLYTSNTFLGYKLGCIDNIILSKFLQITVIIPWSFKLVERKYPIPLQCFLNPKIELVAAAIMCTALFLLALTMEFQVAERAYYPIRGYGIILLLSPLLATAAITCLYAQKMLYRVSIF
uniref:Uncharacterized protein n=1 Tax=Cacopsylla melanoneura TaxID=428564 RepID=A0A8D9ETG1_9HEMI